ncbi:MAG: hypothetical protein M3044_14900, partial [Thermoproteota archaeon]|nr:hypothetical protein [Thermoproteota archaeon]
ASLLLDMDISTSNGDLASLFKETFSALRMGKVVDFVSVYRAARTRVLVDAYKHWQDEREIHKTLKVTK